MVGYARPQVFFSAGVDDNPHKGSAGQPYSTFRFMQDIMGCKIKHACSGGVTHFALAPDDDEDGGVMTIVWGQNAANGELGLGPEEPKSATKPTRNQPLIGIDVFELVPFSLVDRIGKSLLMGAIEQCHRWPEHDVLSRHSEREILRTTTTSRRTGHAG